MGLRNGKIYSSTPTMEEEEQEFCPVTRVTVQVQQPTPVPTISNPQPTVTASMRLPNPMLTFTFTSPTNQGPRAFFRTSNIFQPSAGTYVPFPELLTPTPPPNQEQVTYIAPSTTPVLLTPAMVLYTLAGNTAQSTYVTQPNETVFFAVSNQTPSTSNHVQPNHKLNTTFVAN